MTDKCCQIFLLHNRSGRVIGIAEYQKIYPLCEMAAKIIGIHLKVILFFQRIIEGGTSAQSDFPFIFGICGSQY